MHNILYSHYRRERVPKVSELWDAITVDFVLHFCAQAHPFYFMARLGRIKSLFLRLGLEKQKGTPARVLCDRIMPTQIPCITIYQ